MISSLVPALISAFKARRELALENVALRQQLAVLRRSVKRPRLSNVDRGFWVLLRRIWTDWESVLVIVKPQTVVRWHRCGFRRYWTWKSRRRRPGRPGVAPEIRELIRNMSRANPLWGAPRVHGELAKLGISISQAAVSKYMVRHRTPPSHTWRSFLDNQALLHGPEQIADLPVPVAESPGAVRIGHPERSHLVEYLAPNSVFNSLPRQRSSPHLRPDDRLVTIDRVLHHASLGVA